MSKVKMGNFLSNKKTSNKINKEQKIQLLFKIMCFCKAKNLQTRS